MFQKSVSFYLFFKNLPLPHDFLKIYVTCKEIEDSEKNSPDPPKKTKNKKHVLKAQVLKFQKILSKSKVH